MIDKAGMNDERLSYNGSQSPGPGKYEDKVLRYRARQPSIQFSRSPKYPKEHNLDPGPCTYQVTDSATQPMSKYSTFKKSARNFDR